jgi:hypothetical protein
MRKKYNSNIVVILLFAIISLFVTSNSQAAFLIKSTTTATQIKEPAKEYMSLMSDPKLAPLHINGFKNQPNDGSISGDDSYKGIVAAVLGTTGILALLVALVASLPGLLLVSFFLGMGAIVFGAMRKKKNRALGRLGLILGITNVTLLILLLVAVVVALAVIF